MRRPTHRSRWRPPPARPSSTSCSPTTRTTSHAITDDGPFFWHFAPFGDVIRNIGDPINRQVTSRTPIGERVLLLLLAIASLFAVTFLLLPFVVIRREWRAMPAKAPSAVYFAALGLGFMFYEITMIQRFTEYLGFPTYSLTVTLASLLDLHRPRRAVVGPARRRAPSAPG